MVGASKKAKKAGEKTAMVVTKMIAVMNPFNGNSRELHAVQHD